MTSRICTAPGCGQIIPTGNRCQAHTRKPWPHQASRQTRGYDRHWDKLRARRLAAHPTCEMCHNEPSTSVDHVIPLARGGARLSWHNTQALGDTCRRLKDIADNHPPR